MVAAAAVVSASEETVVVVLAVVFAGLCFARTATFRRRLGRSPWGIHPNLWLVIGFLLGPIGAFLALVACATTPFGPAPPPAPPAPDSPPPGWYPDPSGHHEYRFFTGVDWTADVVDNGRHSIEPLPPPPPNPG